MAYLMGTLFAFLAGLLATLVGLDRDRALYPATLIIIATYYVLFAVIGVGTELKMELAVAAAFGLIALAGFRFSLWLIVAGLVAHGTFDVLHEAFGNDPSVPVWWPGFCAGYDLSAGAYLSVLLIARSIGQGHKATYRTRIREFILDELEASRAADAAGDTTQAFRHLERAHVLGQPYTIEHVLVHYKMLIWGIRHKDLREIIGQIFRLAAAGLKTWIGLVPLGNTGGANVSPFKSMKIEDDLACMISWSKQTQDSRTKRSK